MTNDCEAREAPRQLGNSATRRWLRKNTLSLPVRSLTRSTDFGADPISHIWPDDPVVGSFVRLENPLKSFMPEKSVNVTKASPWLQMHRSWAASLMPTRVSWSALFDLIVARIVSVRLSYVFRRLDALQRPRPSPSFVLMSYKIFY